MKSTSHLTKSKSLWPLAIGIYFLIIIIGIAVFIAWAVHQDMDLVRKDYYAEELQFQNQLDRMNRAQSFAQKPKVSYDSASDSVVIALPRETAFSLGKIHFYRPSDASLDQNVKLSLNADGSQKVDARSFVNGLWKVRVSWIANSEEFFAEETVIINRS